MAWRTLTVDSFDVQASLQPVLDKQGLGIYTVILWAIIDNESEVVSEYPISYETEPPYGYGP